MRNPLQFQRGRMGGIAAGEITAAEAIKAGYPLCYNWDYGTATVADETRLWYVEKPTTANNFYFAGVAAESKPSGYEGPIKMFLPGSLCLVYTNQSCTLGTTIITAQAGEYQFSAAGFRGAGTARAMQTVDRSSTAGTVLALLDEGDQSGLVEYVDVTTSAGAYDAMVGGTTRFAAGAVASEDATFTLADGTWIGERKAFICDGTLTTNDVVVTITTPAVIAAVATSGYNVVTMDAVGEAWMGEWMPSGWFGSGTTAA